MVSTIRMAEAEDVRAVGDLVQRAYAHYVARIGRRPAPMDDDYDSRVRAGWVHVAVQDDQLTGVIVLIARRDHLLIDNVAVDPARQGRGIGRRLMDHAEHVARAAGLRDVRLYTNAAMTENLRLYPRLGYEEVDRRVEHGFDRVFFSKRLD